MRENYKIALFLKKWNSYRYYLCVEAGRQIIAEGCNLGPDPLRPSFVRTHRTVGLEHSRQLDDKWCRERPERTKDDHIKRLPQGRQILVDYPGIPDLCREKGAGQEAALAFGSLYEVDRGVRQEAR